MREDFRYIESLIDDIEYSHHPSDRELANFIDKKLEGEVKDRVIEHLVHCYRCRETVHKVIEHKKKPRIFNNIIMATPLVALVASLLVFIYLPSDIKELGLIDLSQSPTIYKGAKNAELIDKVIDADKILAQLIDSTNLSDIESFRYAQEEEKEGHTKEARGLYKEALKEIIMEESNSKKRLKYKIIVQNRLLQLSSKKDEIKEYRDIIRYEIRIYSLKY